MIQTLSYTNGNSNNLKQYFGSILTSLSTSLYFSKNFAIVESIFPAEIIQARLMTWSACTPHQIFSIINGAAVRMWVHPTMRLLFPPSEEPPSLPLSREFHGTVV